jgi:ribosomal protein S9
MLALCWGHSTQPTATREAIAKAIVEAATQGERDLHRLRDAGLAAVDHAGRVK